MSAEKLKILWDKYLADRMTHAERTELQQLGQDPAYLVLLEQLVEESLGREVEAPTGVDREAVFLQVMERVAGSREPARIRRIRPVAWARYAAAVILLITGCGVWWWTHSHRTGQPPLVRLTFPPAEDVAPGRDVAVLILADGRRIALDSGVSGIIGQQGAVAIDKKPDGGIVYERKAAAPGEAMMNTLETPRGGQYTLTLPDGTQVWLNAASSITYPTVFNGRQRTVRITGEAYFEIAKNKNQPFEVEANGTRVQVLGTKFNINAYPEEDALRTTLVEGGVRVIAGKEKRELLPGQQAVVIGEEASRRGEAAGRGEMPERGETPGRGEAPGRGETIFVRKDPDLASVTAWKDGYFVFHDEGIQSIMRQVSRWYDVQIAYSGAIPTELFNGKVPRNAPVSKLFHLLELTGQAHFTIQGKNITVVP